MGTVEMARRKKNKVPALPPPSLEAQLEAHDEAAPEAPTYGGPWLGSSEDVKLDVPSADRMAWARRRLELTDAIRQRDAKALEDPGADASGNYSPAPSSARGHTVERAHREARKSQGSQFPKRITTQRVIDRYRAQGHITPAEWRAASFLWDAWVRAGAGARLASGYDPVVVSSSSSPGALLARQMDAAALVVSMLADVPYRSRGCVRAVVIEDLTAAEWARGRGFRHHDSEHHGLARLRAGLQALVAIFSY